MMNASKLKLLRVWLIAVLGLLTTNVLADSLSPIAKAEVVLEETDGILAVEAEHFYKQTLTEKRAWHICTAGNVPALKPDPDGSHIGGASGGAYLEILPDSRANHSEKLIQGENFTDKPGLLAVLSYKVHINTPGRYYVWIRSLSTGSEDNGVHVGLDGQWPASGQRWQTVHKQKWAWECKQRTPEVHTGVPMQLFLDIEKAGEHEIMISMREDGFEMDKIVLSRNKDFKPEGKGPAVKVKSGKLPEAFPEGAEPATSEKPANQEDNKNGTKNAKVPSLTASDFIENAKGYYLDKGKWLGDKSLLTGVSLQNSWSNVHQRTLHWINESTVQGEFGLFLMTNRTLLALGYPVIPATRGTIESRWIRSPLGLRLKVL